MTEKTYLPGLHEKNIRIIYTILLSGLTAAIMVFSTLTRDLGLIKTVLSNLAIVLAAILFLYLSVVKRINFYFSSDTIILFLIFVIYVAFNFIYSQFNEWNIDLFPNGLKTLFEFVLVFILTALVLNSVYRKKNLELYFYLINILSWIIVVYSYLQAAGIDFHLMPESVITATFGNKNFYSNYIMFSIYLQAAGLLYIAKKKFRISAAACILNLFVFLILTRSRATWLAFAATSAIAGILIFIKFKKTRIYIFLSVLILSALIIIGLNIEGSPIIKISEQLKILYSAGYDTSKVRIHTYLSAARIIRDNFIFGIGPGAYHPVDPFYRTPLYLYYGIANNEVHSHSEYLQIWTETGTIGIVLYLLLFINLFFKTMHYYFKNPDKSKAVSVLFIFLSLIGTLIENAFGVNLRITSTVIMFWFCFGILIWIIEEKNSGIIAEKSKSYKKIKCNWFYTILLVIMLAVFIFQIKLYYGNFQCEMIMQEATSYERPDSKFLDSSGKEIPYARYNYLVEFYNKSIEFSKYNLESYYKLGHAYYNLNMFDKSLEVYKYLFRFAPYYANINYNIGLCYYGKNNLPAAIYYLKRELYSNSTIDNYKQLYHFIKQLNPEKNNTAVLRSGLWAENDNVIYRSLIAYEYLNYAQYFDSIDQYRIISLMYSNDEYDKSGRFIRNPALSKIQKLESLKNIGVIYYNFLKKPEYAKKYFEYYILKTDNSEEKQKVQNIVNMINRK
ncbi:O-antigen ligase family protein [Candidatus Dependentiae bacterium]|nr:O-antigen ligase family protein [Candidatus Dependentiae bacterium]